MLGSRLPPRTRALEIWRVAPTFLEQAQDDATIVAIRDMERAGIDIITDGEVRRESYSNRFATALEGMDLATTPAPRWTAQAIPTRSIRGPAEERAKHRGGEGDASPLRAVDQAFLDQRADRRLDLVVPEA
jgi:5-methyltetrahydropteroyltriglutamate--homocysteine methyltransferase